MSSFIFSGDTNACLQHFFNRHQWQETQQFVAEFSGVDKSTVRRWKNGRMPEGEALLRVRVLLDLAGYRAEEFIVLAEPVKQFARAIALNLIEPEDASSMLGYQNIKGLYDIVLRGTDPLMQKWYRLERYVDNSQEELEQAVSAHWVKLEELPLEGVVTSVEVSPPSTPLPVETSVRPTKGLAPFATSLVQSLKQSLFITCALGKQLLEHPNAPKLLELLEEQFSREESTVIFQTINRLAPKNEVHR